VTVLDHLAQVAAILLILELMVFLLIFLGIAAGLAFGLRWVNGKTEPAFGKANSYADRATGYVHKGTGYAALPVIVVRKYADTAGAVADAVKRRVGQIEAARSTPAPAPPVAPEPAVAARPIHPE
jgi:hypothetical protein